MMVFHFQYTFGERLESIKMLFFSALSPKYLLRRFGVTSWAWTARILICNSSRCVERWLNIVFSYNSTRYTSLPIVLRCFTDYWVEVVKKHTDVSRFQYSIAFFVCSRDTGVFENSTKVLINYITRSMKKASTIWDITEHWWLMYTDAMKLEKLSSVGILWAVWWKSAPIYSLPYRTGYALREKWPYFQFIVVAIISLRQGTDSFMFWNYLDSRDVSILTTCVSCGQKSRAQDVLKICKTHVPTNFSLYSFSYAVGMFRVDL